MKVPCDIIVFHCANTEIVLSPPREGRWIERWDASGNVVYPSNKPITGCSVARRCSAPMQVPCSGRRAHLMNVNSHWQPQTSPFLLVFINTSAPIDGRTVAVDKSCIYCTNTALSGSTLTHSSVCVRTEGDPFQLLCVGVCQQCSWRQSPLWRPVFRIDTGPRSACSQGPTWGLMNNGERILRATGEFSSLTWLIIIRWCALLSRQVKRRSRPIASTVNFAAKPPQRVCKEKSTLVDTSDEEKNH